MVSKILEQLDRLEEMLDDLGDVGDFEKSNAPDDRLEELWQEIGGEGDEQEVYNFVREATALGFTRADIEGLLKAVFWAADDNTIDSWVQNGESN